jgi:hypothetical protein
MESGGNRMSLARSLLKIKIKQWMLSEVEESKAWHTRTENARSLQKPTPLEHKKRLPTWLFKDASLLRLIAFVLFREIWYEFLEVAG